MQSYISCSKIKRDSFHMEGFFLCWELKKMQNKDIIETNIEKWEFAMSAVYCWMKGESYGQKIRFVKS